MRHVVTVILAILAAVWSPARAPAQEAYKVGAIFSITGPGSPLCLVQVAGWLPWRVAEDAST